VILLVNDDGIDAPGLRALYRALRQVIGEPVLVVAPAHERSGQGHAITLDRALQVTQRVSENFFGFAVDGTPADCTKLGVSVICPEPPRLVVSGINDGPNVGRSLLYSGTLGAALEAAVLGLPALAVSRAKGDGSFDDGAQFAAHLAERMLGDRRYHGRVVNCNIPALSGNHWHEPRVAQHGQAGFVENYRPVRDSSDRTNWRIHGEWRIREDEPDRDATFLDTGHPTITLLAPDLNDDQGLAKELLNRRRRSTP
jgi:5'-nucleotidase